MKCVAPGRRGTITSVLDESAMTLICAGLPTIILAASSSKRISSDLSGVRRRIGCVVSLGNPVSVLCVTGGKSMFLASSSAKDGVDIDNTKNVAQKSEVSLNLLVILTPRIGRKKKKFFILYIVQVNC